MSNKQNASEYLLNIEKGSLLLDLFEVAEILELEPNLSEIKSIFYTLLNLYFEREENPYVDCDKNWQGRCIKQLDKLLKIMRPKRIVGFYFCGICHGKKEGKVYFFPKKFKMFFKKI